MKGGEVLQSWTRSVRVVWISHTECSAWLSAASWIIYSFIIPPLNLPPVAQAGGYCLEHAVCNLNSQFLQRESFCLVCGRDTVVFSPWQGPPKEGGGIETGTVQTCLEQVGGWLASDWNINHIISMAFCLPPFSFESLWIWAKVGVHEEFFLVYANFGHSKIFGLCSLFNVASMDHVVSSCKIWNFIST